MPPLQNDNPARKAFSIAPRAIGTMFHEDSSSEGGLWFRKRYWFVVSGIAWTTYGMCLEEWRLVKTEWLPRPLAGSQDWKEPAKSFTDSPRFGPYVQPC